jgi:hypothetical protein
MMIREKGMAFTYRFERYGLDLPSLILHTLVSPIRSLQQVFFYLFQQRHGNSFAEAELQSMLNEHDCTREFESTSLYEQV